VNRRHSGLRMSGVFVAIVSIALALSGCVATKYRMMPKGPAPPVPLGLTTAQPPVELELRTLIVYDGPGSWKRQALWDEYVVALHNRGEEPLTIVDAALVDFAGASSAPDADPWALAKESQTSEQRYQRAGVAFARSAMPRAFITGASAATGAASGFLSAAVAVVATASVVALPVYYAVVWKMNRSNKAAVMAEFTRRRLVLPLTLAASETRTGSLLVNTGRIPQVSC
jgi:hypothetical protein